MINIFGKLYTLLRRPQQQNETQGAGSVGEQNTEAGKSHRESAESPNNSEWEHVKADTDLNQSGTDVDAGLVEKKLDIQRSEDETNFTTKEVPGNETMDMEAMARLVEEMKIDNGKESSNVCKDTSPNTNSAHTTVVEAKAPEDNESKSPIDKAPEVCGKTESAMPVEVEVGSRSESASSPNHSAQSVEAKAKVPAEMEYKPLLEQVSNLAEKTESNLPTDFEGKRHQGKDEQVTRGKSSDTDAEKNIAANQGEKGGRSQRQPCYYFNKGLKCYKRNKCPYSHDRGQPDEKEDTEEFIREENFDNYCGFVNAMTASGKVVNPKDLLYKLGYQKLDMETMGSILTGQYKVAAAKQRWHWVGQARYYAELFFPNSWIDENLPTKGGSKKSNRARDKQKQRKTNYNLNEQYEGRRGMCQDVRLLENPNLPVISSNLGNKKKETTNSSAGDDKSKDVDEFVTEYSNGIIHEAVRLAAEEKYNTDKVIRDVIRGAMDEGLSESIIMEVIDDVAKAGNSSGTPSKRGKVNKVDINRTPRKRPEELAIGFNYLSEELVKHSPKTVDGGIICLDTLPPSKERPEQLAFGFNYHADKLVKESPRSPKGEIIIPGVVMGSARKARDQLAMGFNYHANVIVKESPKSCSTEEKKVHLGRKKLYDNKDFADENKIVNGYVGPDGAGDASHILKQKGEKERFAFGFSKNAEILAHGDNKADCVLVEKDMNLLQGQTGETDLTVDEECYNCEFDDSFIPTMVPTMLPAGSVW